MNAQVGGRFKCLSRNGHREEREGKQRDRNRKERNRKGTERNGKETEMKRRKGAETSFDWLSLGLIVIR